MSTETIPLKLPNGETLTFSRERARAVANWLWDNSSQPGAAPIAVKLTDALSGSTRPIEVSEREFGALRHALGQEPDHLEHIGDADDRHTDV